MKFKALIAEDERLAREELAYQLQREKDIILCPSAENGRQLLEWNEKYEPDVIFLDVEMPVLSGIEAARKIVEQRRKTNKPKPLFVFITAYEEYAVEAFGIEAVDYLLKPYGVERLRETLGRIRSRLNEPPQPMHGAKLLIEDGEKMVVLHPGEIYYAAKIDRWIEIYTKNERIQTKMTLQKLEKKLSGYPFLRTHRSYLVNLDYIQEIVPWFNGAYNLILKGKKEVKIPVSRAAAKKLFERLQNV
ncbi:LytR/AlgR family response regulator transcription factor [Caenibacillus caldisaponilyticus]|uniref:LytR/AlgR family response regulator transcription factor n=1 Tax=Caenibacillus caldisaponilyticus TaxID=1674942 RepID=UPI00098876E0|nr:LytTR family DNA-binding domain-containing protein [Caenibacillus caldisaponilyticus]